MIAHLLVLLTQSTGITIPLGTYSLPEIAEKLSRPQLRISVAESIHERGALVGILDQSTEQARKLVCNALDLKAVSVGAGRILLSPDPVVLGREERWRRGLVAILNKWWTKQQEHISALAKLDSNELQYRENVLARSTNMGDKEEWSSLQLLLEGDSVVRATAFFADAAPAISVDLLTHRLMRDRITAQLPSDLETAVRLKMARFGQIRNPTMLQRV